MLSKPLLTVHEVAALLKVKETTIRSWINRGELRAIRFGREWRVAVRDLEAFLNDHANRPAAGSAREAGRGRAQRPVNS